MVGPGRGLAVVRRLLPAEQRLLQRLIHPRILWWPHSTRLSVTRRQLQTTKCVILWTIKIGKYTLLYLCPAPANGTAWQGILQDTYTQTTYGNNCEARCAWEYRTVLRYAEVCLGMPPQQQDC